MEYLVGQRAAGVNPKSFSNLFDRLVWLQSDNGSSIRAVLSVWLEGDDFYRVSVALGMEEGFLFDTREAMVACFTRLEERWPEVQGRCNEILMEWDRSVHDS